MYFIKLLETCLDERKLLLIFEIYFLKNKKLCTKKIFFYIFCVYLFYKYLQIFVLHALGYNFRCDI